MFGISRTVTITLVGWLWADILLGLFVIFLAAASPPTNPNLTGPSVDPKPLGEISVPVDGSRLLGDDQSAIAAEQQKFAETVKQRLLDMSEKRPVAIVLAYGANEDPVLGEKIARIATQGLTQGQFSNAAIKSMHDIQPGDRGTHVTLEIYVYR
jgi:hypothetical protein